MVFRITTWNVNGIRNPFGYHPWCEKRTYEEMFSILESDIVVLQECKIQRKDLTDDMVLVPGWDAYFSLPKHKKGYSGVAIYTRNATCSPIRAEEGITGVLSPPGSSVRYRDLAESQQIGGYPLPDQLLEGFDETTLDAEGRCVILEFPAFVLLGVYSPASCDQTRADFREAFFHALDVRVRNLAALGKQVVLTGDLNVTRDIRDSCGIVSALAKANIKVDEYMNSDLRRIFNQQVFDGEFFGSREEGRSEPVLWDLCRDFHPDRSDMYTCWDTRRNTRPANNGSRIDYVLCSSGLRKWVVNADIQPGLMGSDHCPVYAEFADTIVHEDQEQHLLDLMAPPGTFCQGIRAKPWSTADCLAQSARLLPEFSGRMSIKNMFARHSKPSQTLTAQTTKSQNKGDIQQTLAHPDTAPNETTPTQFQEDQQQSQNQNRQSRSPTSSFSETIILPQKSTQNIPLSAAAKRPAAAPPPAQLRETKKTRTISAAKKGSGAAGPKQSKLSGFFQVRTKGGTACSQSQTDEAADAGSEQTVVATVTEAPARPPLPEPASTRAGTIDNKAVSAPAVTLDSNNERVYDPIEAKESWSGLLGSRQVPLCEHKEACISLRTKKPGMNCGRSFFMCARPLGPSGEKEKDTEWRCGTFIWSSEWSRSLK
ncbi:uncharacterized protein BROUX77_003509 [Berkeleyomyces rouxiae]|uniref:uncharacterized protein n=1 Tax=Berkeleyomyces rouxiae TaxID=2035830 RepID=UPI003B79FB9B